MTARTLFCIAALLCAARALRDSAESDANDGALIVAGIVGAIVVLCWLCARVSDTRNSS